MNPSLVNNLVPKNKMVPVIDAFYALAANKKGSTNVANKHANVVTRWVSNVDHKANVPRGYAYQYTKNHSINLPTNQPVNKTLCPNVTEDTVHLPEE